MQSVHNKLLLTNWLVFLLGESIGFIMHSKGSESEAPPLLGHNSGMLDQFGQPYKVHKDPLGFRLNDQSGTFDPNQFGYIPPQPPNANQENQAGENYEPEVYQNIRIYARDNISERDMAALLGISRNTVIKIKNRLNL